MKTPFGQASLTKSTFSSLILPEQMEREGIVWLLLHADILQLADMLRCLIAMTLVARPTQKSQEFPGRSATQFGRLLTAEAAGGRV